MKFITGTHRAIECMCSPKYLANIMVLLSDAFWRNYKSSLFSMLQLWAGGRGMRQKIDKSADEQFIKFPLTALSAELRGCALCAVRNCFGCR